MIGNLRRWLALSVMACLMAAPSSTFAGPLYLALGDSSAYGETNRTKNPSNGDRGYVSIFADYLATAKYGGTRPTVLNLAINGETTSSYSAGSGRVSSDGQGFNTNYNGLAVPYAQQTRLNDLLGSSTQANQVKTVTVQLGANNLDAVGAQPDFFTISDAERQARVGAALQQVQSDYVGVLTDLKTRFPDANIYTLGYHNPYNGDPSHPLYNLADPAIQGLNQVISGVSYAMGTTFVDVYGAIHPNEASLTLMSTWQTDPVNYVHLTEEGYERVGAALVATAVAAEQPPGIPEPSTWVLSALGVMGLAGWRWRSRRTAALAC